ncbi:ABC transporter ATP-binding protein [Arenibacter sp. GZD96]|uniref:ABC transporter ATP-binding protein n=1 Tax=Aurantibrevibacter litoralis TaxID=3106030 RepID=UPI002AFE8FFE|nr:ABC transporter ATP-binding protein [Arenibacter sp. GZD-96]MEA1787160.1 ABC transporter ATP-binding protein [Arenibacter sp. GZD-96]
MIEIKGLHKSYGDLLVLVDVNLNIYKGEIVNIFGNNGVGKTTILKCLLGLTNINKGQILLTGIDKSDIGIVFSRDFLIPKLKVREYLVFIYRLKKNVDKYPKDKETYLLNLLGLESEKEKFIYSLSKGNQQKLMLLSALITSPKLLILDEPFDGMDRDSITNSKKLFKEFVKNNGAVLMITHRVEAIRNLEANVVFLENRSLSEKIKWSQEIEKQYFDE